MSKNILYAILVFVIIALAFIYFNKNKNEGNTSLYKKISQSDAKAMMDEGGVIILDVRTEEEFASGHIPNALNHSSGKMSTISNTVPDKNATILVYCRSGVRSRGAVSEMIKQGYTNVIDFGGIMSWKYDIVR
ncbi:MAG: rhodanese-like domain-containing protein [Christensenellaceae bacterium]|nr:rhodanese-like domain-containing protein [Christensenellaceae bacterium]